MTLPKDLAAKKQWETIGFRHHHGIAVPLFSLWSEKSTGVGEYLDLLPLIDWCQEVGFNIIQLLPLNDTQGEASPYSAVSAFALNPIHLSLSALRGFDGGRIKKSINRGAIDYPSVMKMKEAFLRDLFEQEGRAFMQSGRYQKFLDLHPWLEGFSLYKAIRMRGDEALGEGKIEVNNALLEDADYHAFVQYLCFQQMSEVRDYAEAKGILIKGDVPILIAERSADVVLNEDLFRIDLTAGAPPDTYCKDGQNWGFPLYDWDRAQDKILAWWKERLEVVAGIYHLYRLDHVVGLFRIWGVPPGEKPTQGFFVPRDESLWIPRGTKVIRSFLNECPLLPIAEDLGTVPQEVRSTLQQLGVPGTKVLRWEFTDPVNPIFTPVSSYPAMSMATIATHDTETMKSWWESNKLAAQAFAEANSILYSERYDDQMREAVLRLSHGGSSLFHINPLQEYFPETSPLFFESEESARINDPANDRRALNWRVRFKEPVERIALDKSLKKMVKAVLTGER
ncbi:4-alpha-glucanotransferase [Estrella lausannensis]|uniref:4-alpha-glucanotransferase n=1 Tax=Estrella lausannensis TaxID=483423 RepID=A0A0H5DP98_9BACT|nr:4-alpha-glucanotransferase [Estrella lausannensis]CRX38217.1 4-alpha-glucanotransferase [Estrella lausannensis]